MSCLLEGFTRPRMVRTSATAALRRCSSPDITGPRQVISQALSQPTKMWPALIGMESLEERRLREAREAEERERKLREIEAMRGRKVRWREERVECACWPDLFILYRAVLVRVPRFTAWRLLKLSLWLLTRFIPFKLPTWGLSRCGKKFPQFSYYPAILSLLLYYYYSEQH